MSAEPESGDEVRLRNASPAQETQGVSTCQGNPPEGVRRTEERPVEGSGNEKIAEQAGGVENAGDQSGGHSTRSPVGDENETGGQSAQPLSFGGEQSGGRPSQNCGQNTVVNVTRNGQVTPSAQEVESHDTGGQNSQVLSLIGAPATSFTHAGGGQGVVAMDTEDDQEVASERVIEVGKSGGQGAQVILLATTHHKTRPLVGGPAMADDSTSVDDSPSGQIAQWLRTILPNVSDGWWEVRAAGQGISLKFRWIDQTRQTIGFPRLNTEEFRNLKDAGDEEARRMIRERMAEHLRRLLLHPAKRDKALAAAEKLGIDLDLPDAPDVHTFKINQMR